MYNTGVALARGRSSPTYPWAASIIPNSHSGLFQHHAAPRGRRVAEGLYLYHIMQIEYMPLRTTEHLWICRQLKYMRVGSAPRLAAHISRPRFVVYRSLRGGSRKNYSGDTPLTERTSVYIYTVTDDDGEINAYRT